MVNQTIPVDISTLEQLKNLIAEGGSGFQYNSSSIRLARLTSKKREDRLRQALLIIEELIKDLNHFDEMNDYIRDMKNIIRDRYGKSVNEMTEEEVEDFKAHLLNKKEETTNEPK